MTSTPAPRNAAALADAILGIGDDHRASAGCDAVVGEACGAAREPHTREVVAGEDAVGLERPRRDDHPGGLDLDELLGPDERDRRPLVDADRGVPLRDLDARRARLGGQAIDGLAGRGVRHGGADPSLVGEEHPTLGRRRRGETGDAAADHEHVDANETGRLGAGGRPREGVPVPVARRITFSASPHAQRGRTNIL